MAPLLSQSQVLPWRILLGTPPAGAHILQLYSDPAQQIEAATIYVSAGLKNKEKVVLADTKKRLDNITDRLKEDYKLNLDEYIASGQLVLLEAEEAIEGLVKDGRPDEGRMKQFFLNAEKEAEDAGFWRVRFCARLVPLVYDRGAIELALAMETTWQEFSRNHKATALCAYSSVHMKPTIHNESFWKQLEAHTYLLPDSNAETGLAFELYKGSSG